MPDPFEIVVGTYEQYLLGYKVNNIVNEYKMEKTFATHSHVGSIRSVANGKNYLASGGADDSVYLYDLRYRLETGRLMHHNDTVNCVAFTPDASHVFTCSNDGTIAAVRCGNWQLEKHWQKPHKGFTVNTLAIHPTGKIALSTGADGILRTWNLVKGRQAYATNLVPRLKLDAKNVNVLKWSPNGEKYLLAVNQRIDIYSVELAGIDSEIKFDSKIVCVEFLKDDLIAVGLENGQLKFYDLEKSVQTVEAVAHDIRVKCMAFKDDLLVTASSSGEIKLWRYRKHKLDILQTVNCGTRITCLSLASSYNNLISDREMEPESGEEATKKKKKKKKKKLRLKQEVIVEVESDREAAWMDDSRKKLTKKKSKKKRSIEEVQTSVIDSNRKRNKSILKKKKVEDDTTIDNGDYLPKKKKSKSSNNDSGSHDYVNDKAEDESLNRDGKKRFISPEENNNVCFKKARKSNESEVKSMGSKEDGKVVLKKRKKEKTVEETGPILKKKKKKQ